MPTLPTDSETIAELRELYRAAEARAARLRLLSVSGRKLAEAAPDNLDSVLQECADALAFFAGCRSAEIKAADFDAGIPIHAPGADGARVAMLVVKGLPSLRAIPDSEDREALRMQIEMMGSTIERIKIDQERSALLTELQEREKTLEVLLKRIFTAQEEERRRVSHELHDGVAQDATALVRLLESMEGRGKGDAISMSPVSVARSLVSELRRVIAGLRPTLLDDLGFFAALNSLADGLEDDGFAVNRHFEGDDRALSSLQETALFRVAQEAITNIHKHAGGSCPVFLEANLDADPMVLQVADLGKGPSTATLASSGIAGHNVGIDVMKERMSAICGVLEWSASDAGGVTVKATLPRTPAS
ncbi:MAG: histidine kinase [Pseudomonadota bacterium]